VEEAYILLDLTLVILTAKVLEELMSRIKQPPLLGDLMAGILIGPTVFGLIKVTDNVKAIGWLGVVLLIFLAGLETNIEDLRKYSKPAILVAIGGVFATFSMAYIASIFLGYSWYTSLFIAVILAPTSVSVTVATLMELNMLRTKIGETVIGAAVADDIYAMILFGLVYSLLTGGSHIYQVSWIIAGLAVLASIFILLKKYSAGIMRILIGKSRLADAPYTHVLIVGLTIATMTAFFKLSPIVGAYFAGLALSPLLRSHHLESYYRLLVEFISPFFFVYAGLLLDPWSALVGLNLSKALETALVIVVIGVLGKVLGCGIAAKLSGFDARSSITVGIAMMPRAGVDLVIAVTGLSLGVLSMELYFSVLMLIYITSFTTPVLIKILLKRE